MNNIRVLINTKDGFKEGKICNECLGYSSVLIDGKKYVCKKCLGKGAIIKDDK